MEENEEIKNFLSECKNMLIHIDMLETTQRFTNNFEKAIKQNLNNPTKTRQLQNLVNQFDMLLNQFIEEEI